MAREMARPRSDWRAGLAGAVAALSTRTAGLRRAAASATGIRPLHMMVALIAPILMLLTVAFMAQQQNADALQREQARAVTLQRYALGQASLLGYDNVLLTPHMAARTHTAVENMSWVVRDIVEVLNGRPPRYPAP